MRDIAGLENGRIIILVTPTDSCLVLHLINRLGVAGAVPQSPPSLIN
jgi:hypothetical protein